MPLRRGKSREVVSENIATMMREGYSQRQAVAAALAQTWRGHRRYAVYGSRRPGPVSVLSKHVKKRSAKKALTGYANKGYHGLRIVDLAERQKANSRARSARRGRVREVKDRFEVFAYVPPRKKAMSVAYKANLHSARAHVAALRAAPHRKGTRFFIVDRAIGKTVASR